MNQYSKVTTCDHCRQNQQLQVTDLRGELDCNELLKATKKHQSLIMEYPEVFKQVRITVLNDELPNRTHIQITLDYCQNCQKIHYEDIPGKCQVCLNNINQRKSLFYGDNSSPEIEAKDYFVIKYLGKEDENKGTVRVRFS